METFHIFTETDYVFHLNLSVGSRQIQMIFVFFFASLQSFSVVHLEFHGRTLVMAMCPVVRPVAEVAFDYYYVFSKSFKCWFKIFPRQDIGDGNVALGEASKSN